jgi:hypothetical protein
VTIHFAHRRKAAEGAGDEGFVGRVDVAEGERVEADRDPVGVA